MSLRTLSVAQPRASHHLHAAADAAAHMHVHHSVCADASPTPYPPVPPAACTAVISPCALSGHGLTTAVATSGTCMVACVCIHMQALGDLPKQMRQQCRGGHGACCSCFNQPMTSDMKCWFHCLAECQSGRLLCMGVGNFQQLLRL
jgi:hypothetical protein